MNHMLKAAVFAALAHNLAGLSLVQIRAQKESALSGNAEAIQDDDVLAETMVHGGPKDLEKPRRERKHRSPKTSETLSKEAGVSEPSPERKRKAGRKSAAASEDTQTTSVSSNTREAKNEFARKAMAILSETNDAEPTSASNLNMNRKSQALPSKADELESSPKRKHRAANNADAVSGEASESRRSAKSEEKSTQKFNSVPDEAGLLDITSDTRLRTDPAWNDMGLGPDASNATVLFPDDGKPFVNFDLCAASYHSNLAGAGPDSGEESIRYYRVASAGGGQLIDLVVTANSSYKGKNVSMNGLTMGDGSGNGCFGMVNLKTHFSGYREVPLLFTFYLTGTNTSVALNRFYMTVVDIDMGASAVEKVTFYNRVNNIYYRDNHTMNFSGDLSTFGLTSCGGEFGTSTDNPKDPLNMSDSELQRAVMVEYVNLTQWKVNWAISGGKGGRNFVFAGRSNIIAVNSTTTTSTCATRDCVVFADPHVSGFDNMDNPGPKYLAFYRGRDEGKDEGMEEGTGTLRMFTFHGRPVDVDALDTGDFWLVKSEPVHIQARFRLSGEFIPDKAAVGAVAVGGPFLQNYTLTVEPLDGQVSINGKPISGDWSDMDRKIYVRQESDEDVEADLPMSVKLKFRRFPKHIDVKITMPALPGGVDGECGNYDGLAENDDDDDLMGRMGSVHVDDSMLLFSNKFSEYAEAFGGQSSGITEDDYQAVVALRDDEAMAEFVRLVLASEDKTVPPEEEGNLQGFAQWFSGTMGVGSLEQMKKELTLKPWVQDRPAADATAADATPKVPAAKNPPKKLKATSAHGDDSACSDCLVWGASHFLSFSAFRKHAVKHPKQEALFRTQDWEMARQSLDDEGTYWLVKTQSVHIQGRFWTTQTNNQSSAGAPNLGALAVAGPFLEDNALFIKNGEVMWNGQKILVAVPSNFSNRFFSAEHTPYSEIISNGMLGRGIVFTFNNGMSLVVNPHHQVLDARIHMCESEVAFGGAEGHCGSFKASQHADEVAGPQGNWKLDKNESIFPDGTARPLLVGDRVRVREDETAEWLFGKVSSLNPLKVVPDFYDTEFEWEIVEAV